MGGEGAKIVYDWDRSLRVWRTTEGFDDGKRFLPLNSVHVVPNNREVVLAVSISYSVDTSGLKNTFPDSMPIYRLDSEECVADKYWSAEKQKSLVVRFRDTVQHLLNSGVQRIHLVLAAPSSLALRMGMSYDRRNFPEVIVYQFERSCMPPYPWGVLMPTHGVSEAVVTRTPLTSMEN